MKFKIDHVTGAFYYGRIIPLLMIPAALVMIVALGINHLGRDISRGIFTAVCLAAGAAEVIFIILYEAERLRGTDIIIKNGQIDICMLFRKKTIFFYEIENVKYSHYVAKDSRSPREGIVINPDRFYTSNRTGITYRKNYNSIFDTVTTQRTRFQLVFYLSGDRTFRLNDGLNGFNKYREFLRKQNASRVSYRMNPDEDVALYRAYQCYKAARRGEVQF